MKRKRGTKKGEEQTIPGLPDERPDVFGIEGEISIQTITLYCHRPEKPAKATVEFRADHGDVWTRQIDITVPKKLEEKIAAIAFERARPDATEAPAADETKEE